MTSPAKAREQFLSHRKPQHAAKHVPEGHTAMKKCPTCHGKGTVKAEQTMSQRILGGK